MQDFCVIKLPCTGTQYCVEEWGLSILLISTVLGTEQQTPNLRSGGPRFGSHSEYELHWEVSHSFFRSHQANIRTAAQIRSRFIPFVSYSANCSVRILSLNNAVRAAGSVINHLTPNGHFSGHTAPLTSRCCIFLFIQQIYVLNILNMLHTLCFFLFKMPFIS